MRILAVDDDPIILELISELLSAFGGHKVDTVGSAHEAIQVATRSSGRAYDCFLLDLQMPGTDGIELCRQLRAAPQYHRTPIIMITAMSDKAYIDRAFYAGASDYVTKPFDITELRFRIQNAEARMAGGVHLTRKVFAVSAKTNPNNPANRKPELNDPISIHQVDGVIDYFAFENYVNQLSRSALFGSTVFAFAITGIEALHRECDAADFVCLISDTAEAVSECLQANQFLATYAGNGTFVCVLEDGHRPDMKVLTTEINQYIRELDLRLSDGRALEYYVCPGAAHRLIWCGGRGATEAIFNAYSSAENEALRVSRNMVKFMNRKHAV